MVTILLVPLFLKKLTKYIWLLLTFDLLEDRRIDSVSTDHFAFLLHRKNRFNVAVGLFNSRFNETSVIHSVAPRVVHAMICYWKDARQHGIHFLKQSKLKEGRYEQNKGHRTRLEKFANDLQCLQEVLHVFDLLISTT